MGTELTMEDVSFEINKLIHGGQAVTGFDCTSWNDLMPLVVKALSEQQISALFLKMRDSYTEEDVQLALAKCLLAVLEETAKCLN